MRMLRSVIQNIGGLITDAKEILMDGNKQNQWVSDYVAPIMINGDVEKATDNFKYNRRLDLRNKMRETGVFESLENLEEGTSWDKVQKDLVEKTSAGYKVHQINFGIGIDVKKDLIKPFRIGDETDYKIPLEMRLLNPVVPIFHRSQD